MEKLKIEEIIALINAEKTFEGTVDDGSFRIKINRYLPYCCTAIHDGGNLRPELSTKIALDDYDRWYEEDPSTGDFIASMPITLIGCDTRFEYDLNRNPDECIYEEAWGKKVWKKPLSSREKQVSKRKHANYYKVLHALIKKLEELFDGCVVYDLHSYNHQRWDRPVPLFNIGTERIDEKRYGPVIKNWQSQLGKVKIRDIENEPAINDVFKGRGYNLEFVTKNFNNTLVLATEVSKIYCNELTGESYPRIIKILQQGLKRAIVNNANFFSQKSTNWKHKSAAKLLDRKIDPSILKVDKALYGLLKNFELLAFVNPVNSSTEKRKFIRNKFNEPPKFKYRPIRINPYRLKQKLNELRTQDIPDITIRHLYESVINAYFDKIDMLATLSTNQFFYNSLRYFGRPSKNDIENAYYIMRLPEIAGQVNRSPSLGTKEAIATFEQGLSSYGFDFKIEESNKIISQVMVLNSKKTIQFRPDAKFNRTELHALVEHEIGVHVVTTNNSNLNHLKIFNLGLPVNTKTQEGLAFLSEYLSGNITMMRLKKLAYRVIIVDMMCDGADFRQCFNFLHDTYVQDPDEAFSIVARIFRGGGFTKDYLYLTGFVEMLRFWQNENDLNPLLIGKTSLGFYNSISEMLERDMIEKPKFITQSFVKPKKEKNHEIFDYILSGLK